MKNFGEGLIQPRCGEEDRGRTAIGAGLLSLSLAAPNANAAAPILEGLGAPVGIASAADGSTFISNWSGGTVERIDANGKRSIFLHGIAAPAGIAVDPAGAVFVSSYSEDYILRVDPDGTQKRVIENLATPTGLAFANDGKLLVANRASGEILSVDVATGQSETVAKSLSLPVGVVQMPDGSVVVSQYGGRVTRVHGNGSVEELGSGFVRPGVGIVADGRDAVFVVDNGASGVRRVAFDGTSHVIVKGLPGSAVALDRDHSGNLLVGTWGSGHVYRVPVR